MDILSSGYLRSILCLIGISIVQMFSKQKTPILYQGKKMASQQTALWRIQEPKWTVDHAKHKKPYPQWKPFDVETV